jgi:hypothetical protein
VTRRRVSTSNVSQKDRDRLAAAVSSARAEAGFDDQRSFAVLAGVSLRSLGLVEAGREGVGHGVLTKIGKGLGLRLEGWTAATPVRVLAGDPPPVLVRKPGATSAIEWAQTASDEDIDRQVKIVAEISGAALAARFRSDIDALRTRPTESNNG